MRIPEGIACKHPGCLHHITKPCDGCGRIGGRGVFDKNAYKPCDQALLQGSWLRVSEKVVEQKQDTKKQ